MPEALVVGAGPAGLSAAIALRRAGADVVVLEQHPSPPPRVCGAFINPEGAAHLDWLGVMQVLLDSGAVPVTECRVTWRGGEDVRVSIVRDSRAGLAVPRPTLERVLADRLAALGGAVSWGARVVKAGRAGQGWSIDVVTGVTRRSLTAPFLVVADGRFSSLSGRHPQKSRAGWFGWNASFVGIDQPPGALALHFGRDGYVGLLTFGDGVTNVCGLTYSNGMRALQWHDVLSAAVREQPALFQALRNATRVDAFRGVGPLPFSRTMWKGPGPLLAGDAAAVGDPYMGEGISRALGTGPVLADGLAPGDLTSSPAAAAARYNRRWRARYHPRLRLGTAARWLFMRPRLSAPLVGQVVSRPSLLRMVLSVAHSSPVPLLPITELGGLAPGQDPGPSHVVEDLTIQLSSVESRPVAPVGSTRVPAVILYDGDEIGGLHSLTKDETVIGRTAGCDIVIPESRVSRRHAVIRRMTPGEDRFEVVDLGSTNGTFVDDDRVDRLMLVRGSKVAIGGRILKFEMLDRTDVAYQSRIVQMIHLDELTGLLTKRSLFRALEMELIRTERYRHPLSVLMMDLDHFKQVNDSYGHLVGSHCLSEVGALIREATRVTDVSGRYGGEEFVSFLPETDTSPALMVAERIREAMAARSFQHHETRYHVRISIGISTYPANGTTVEGLVQSADIALYQAKSQGRNRCVVAGDKG